MTETVFTKGMSTITSHIAAYDDTHRPDPKQVSGRWRVDCSCGWRGPVVPLPGHGTAPWTEHFTGVQ